MSEPDAAENPCAVAWDTAFEKQPEYCGTGEMMVQAERLLGVDASDTDFDGVLSSGLSASICTAPDASQRRLWVLGRVFWANQADTPLIEKHDYDVRSAIDAGLREADGVCLDLAEAAQEPEPEPEPEPESEPEPEPEPEPEVAPEPE